MIPFLSITGTGSHVTRMAVEDLVRACTLSGGAFGTIEKQVKDESAYLLHIGTYGVAYHGLQKLTHRLQRSDYSQLG